VFIFLRKTYINFGIQNKNKLSQYDKFIRPQLKTTHMKRTTIVSFFFIIFGFPVFSQGMYNDSTLVARQVANGLKLYDNYTGPQASIYNGSEYIAYIFKREGMPFFLSDTMALGWVGYEGRIYQQMIIQYDIARNQVLLLNSNRRSKIVLHNELIDSFYFSNHTFKKLVASSVQNLSTTGFYDVLYNGNVKVYANRKKLFKDVIKDNELVRIFGNEDRYYIFKGGKYYLVNNKKDVYNLLNDKKSEIKSAMRRRKIKFRKNNFEEALLVATEIYDQH
jgi:hypothetical protein